MVPVHQKDMSSCFHFLDFCDSKSYLLHACTIIVCDTQVLYVYTVKAQLVTFYVVHGVSEYLHAVIARVTDVHKSIAV